LTNQTSCRQIFWARLQFHLFFSPLYNLHSIQFTMPPSSRPLLSIAKSRICHSCQRSLSAKAYQAPNVSSTKTNSDQKSSHRRLPNDTSRTNKQSNQTLLSMLESLRQGAEAKAHARRAAAAEKAASEKPSLSKYINAASMMQKGSTVGDNTRLTERQRRVNDLQRIQDMSESRELELKMRGKLGRSWERGDIYAPKDLGVLEQKKWMEKQPTRTTDPFLLSGRNPLEFYKVCLMSSMISN
jgi:hypothetical protein